MIIEALHDPAPPPPPPTIHLELTLEEFALIRALAYRHMSVNDKQGADLYNDIKSLDHELGIVMSFGAVARSEVETFEGAQRLCGLSS